MDHWIYDRENKNKKAKRNVMFSDQVIIIVKAGNGGDGAVSFHKERFVPKGGPDGGDGGKGGDVFIKSDVHTNTLIQLYRHPHLKASNGKRGSGQKKRGKDGSDLWLNVPVGTIVEDLENCIILADLSKPDDHVCVADGGLGGKGNFRFRSSVNRSPNFAQKGQIGQERKLRLNLKLIADAGLVGLPNAGKSTLLSLITAAKPKIADYPFTTLEPSLGIVQVDEEHSFVLADIPGLIEGAHHGIGLGTRFLKHIERTKVLVHLIDGSRVITDNLFHDFKMIENELKQYSPILERKERIVIVNKIDLLPVKEKKEWIRQSFMEKGISVFFVSALTGIGIRELIFKIYQIINIVPEAEIQESEQKQDNLIHYRYQPAFLIRKEGNTFIVEGEKITQLVSQYDLNNPQALKYFQKKLKYLGIEKALRKKGILNGNRVIIGEKDFYFYD